MSHKPDPYYRGLDPEQGLCDSCSEYFPLDDLLNHDDGNTYCVDCCYLTKQDRIDGEADDARSDLDL